MKKTLIIFIISLLLIAGIGVAVIIIKDNGSSTAEENEKVIGQYGSTKTYTFYPSDEVITDDIKEQYNQLDRSIYYTNAGETIAINEENRSSFGDDVNFFLDYFNAVIAGDNSAYDAMFTENYLSENEKLCEFTPQMLYDINIEKLSKTDKEENTVYSYNVTYKIFRNNGTFRNDIGSDGSKTLYFELLASKESVKIDKINYYVD